MKKYFLLTITAICLAAKVSAAAPTPEFKLGVADFQYALNNVEEGKKMKTTLKSEFEAKQKEIEKQKTAIEKLQSEIKELQQKASSGLLNPKAMEEGRKKEEDFRKKLDAYSVLVNSAQKEIGEKEAAATRGILGKLRDFAVDLGRTKGMTMVLEKNESGLIYAAASVDITEELIQKYNAANKGKK